MPQPRAHTSDCQPFAPPELSHLAVTLDRGRRCPDAAAVNPAPRPLGNALRPAPSRARVPHVVQNPARDDRRDPVARPGNRRERRDLLAVQRAPAGAAARSASRPAGQLCQSGPTSDVLQLRHGRGLRRGLRLPDVSRHRTGGAEDGLQRDRRPHAVQRKPRHARAGPITGDGTLVSGSYFSVLGLQPALGRLLDRTVDLPIEANYVTVLSYAFWENALGANTAVLGKQITVNGQSLTIIGVAPRGFSGTTLGVRPDVFVPISMAGLMIDGWKGVETDRDEHFVYLFGRLAPRATIAQASASINPAYHAIINDVEAPRIKGLSAQTAA